MVLCQTALLVLAALPLSIAQISDNFESGWNQTIWPIYAPDCNQVILFSYNVIQCTVLKFGKWAILSVFMS